MSYQNDEWLRHLAADAYKRPEGELLMVLMDQRDDRTEAYEALLIRAREVLVTRYNLDRVTHLLGHLSRPKCDTMIQLHRAKQ